MTEKRINDCGKAELTMGELEKISGGGEYGDLLRKSTITYEAICECGYQENVICAYYGRVICPKCKKLIRNYREGENSR